MDARHVTRREQHLALRVPDISIPGVVLTDLVTLSDDRGGFTELFRRSFLPHVPSAAQVNLSTSGAGVLRGMHYHRKQSDYWCVMSGEAFVGLYDLRQGAVSPAAATTLSLDSTRGLNGLFIPAGVAHGFLAVSDVSLLYMVDTEYTGQDEFGFAWDDPDLAIDWPVSTPVVSKRDASNPSLRDTLAGNPVSS
jgi:dTDP-4-dehydrorhamnose 3,5-epimerase